MKQTIVMRGGALILALALVFGATFIPVLAHDGEDHSEVKEMSLAEMEQVIGIMQKLIMLLTTLRTMQPTMTTPVVHTPQEMKEHHDEHSDKHEEEHEHEHEHASNDHHGDEAKLIVEVEPHNNQTHVHVRYVDKPEEMFFVNAGMNNEDGIVSEVSARTGLSQHEVRAALKYLQ
jgi:ABC-type nickel/cobalt efflux system permease component RcnA